MYAWTPLVDASMFTGITTDVTTAGTGILSVAVIIVGIFFIIRAFQH